MIDPMADARKDDRAKTRLELIPPEAVRALGRVLTHGADKYGDRNWEQGMAWGRVFGAAQRHLWAWWGGEDCDPETGEPHLAHALCNLAFLVAYAERGVGLDDRLGGSESAQEPPLGVSGTQTHNSGQHPPGGAIRPLSGVVSRHTEAEVPDDPEVRDA